MSKITRIFHKIFGASADFGSQMSVFGSYKNGASDFASDAADGASLSNWDAGLYGALVANSTPCAQDLNMAFHHSSRQLGYLFQSGIPEYDASTIYYTNSFCSYNGVVYKSLVDSNTGNTPTDGATWQEFLAHPNCVLAKSGATVQVLTANTYNYVKPVTKTLDALSQFNTSTGVFTPAKTGFYSFSLMVEIPKTGSDFTTFSDGLHFEILKYGTGPVARSDVHIDTDDVPAVLGYTGVYVQFSATVYLEKDDTVYIVLIPKATSLKSYSELSIVKLGA